MDCDDKIIGIISIITDGIKDTNMFMEYAADAAEEGDEATAAMFHKEAMRRITGADEWYQTSKELLHHEEHAEEVASAFLARMCEHLKETTDRVMHFKH